MSDGLKPCPHRQVDDGGRILCGLIRGGDSEVSVNLCRACPVPQINCQHLRASMQKQVSIPLTVRYATGRIEVWNDEAPTISFKRAACAEKTMPIHSPRDCAGCPLRAPVVVPQNAVQVARRNKPVMQPAPTLAAGIPLAAQLPGAFAAAAEARPASQAPAQPAARAAARTIAKSNGRSTVKPEPPALPVPAPNLDPVDRPAIESAAVHELVQRAQALAADKYREARRAAVEHKPEQAAAGTNKSKIILLQQWLADQFIKKNAEAQATESLPDAEGVQDIIYTPIAPVYNEESGTERCVGWTD